MKQDVEKALDIAPRMAGIPGTSSTSSRILARGGRVHREWLPKRRPLWMDPRVAPWCPTCAVRPQNWYSGSRPEKLVI